MARSGGGKSTLMRWVGLHNARLGQRVVHFQAEGSEQDCLDLYDSGWTGIMTESMTLGSIPENQGKKIEKVRRDIILKGGEIYVYASETFDSMSLEDAREILLDILNLAKVVYKNGLSGTLILGERLNKIFTALPEHFTVTDYDIHIADSGDIIKEQELIKQLTMEFIKGGMVDSEVILEAITAKSLTGMKADVNIALTKKREETNQLGQLNQQVQQLDQQLKQATAEAKKLQGQVQSLNAEKLALDKERLAFEKELEWFKARAKSANDEALIEFEGKRVQLEAAQLLDDSRQNDEVRQGPKSLK